MPPRKVSALEIEADALQSLAKSISRGKIQSEKSGQVET